MAYGGWDVIDHLKIDQCANRLPRIHTVESIPNSLQTESTEAWNAVHRLRQATMTEAENERALKWILWLPQGLLHAPQRGGKNGTRQYKEPARRFVMWRQKDMLGLIKAWKMAVVTAEKRLAKARARKAEEDQARIARAIRLLRECAIYRAGQTLESKGLGDLDNPKIWEQLQRKHPERKQNISEDVFKMRPDEEVELKVEKIPPKLDMNAASGPSGLRYGHIRIWAGAFAPPSADEAIEWLEKLLTDMANDKMLAWFMEAI
jgi:hypothetical protein